MLTVSEDELAPNNTANLLPSIHWMDEQGRSKQDHILNQPIDGTRFGAIANMEKFQETVEDGD